ncbi:MAG: lamin tail domain-containing protein [Ignavibacteriae bacterium]|nr:lamin tail domain-containing protein [Ignavibacteriota bacterium]
MRALKTLALLFIPFLLVAQVQQFPFTEHFDADTLLPVGWSSSRNRDTSKNDFTISTSSVRSTPHAVISTNATVSQNLYSPFFDFSNEQPETLSFYERRSGTHNSVLLIEASNDSGQTFFSISDTLKNVSSSYVLRAVALPDSLAGKNNVRFRWRIVGDGTGTTGTIRFDDISVTTATQIDVAVTSVSFLPLTPFVDDSITISATVKNIGNDSVQNLLLSFYLDANNDSLPQSSELISTRLVNAVLHQNDSATVQTIITFPTAGMYRIISKAKVTGDEDSTNDSQMISISVGWKPRSLVVNEIMYAPTSPEPEWIELTSTISDSINLRGWKISDKTTTTRYTITNSDLWVHQNEYLVLTKDSSALLEPYPFIQHYLQLPSMPTQNNDSDAVVIFDQRGVVMESVYYHSTWGGKNNRSLERIETTDSSNSNANWGTSNSINRATPGMKNSHTPKDFDLLVRSLSFIPPFPSVGDSIQIQATIFNNGKNNAASFDVSFFEDTNNDSLFTADELFQTVTLHSLTTGDSVTIQELRTDISFGNHLFQVRITFVSDEDTTNNTQTALVVAGYQPQTIIINEIMYAPPSSEPEWIELYNNSAFIVDLKDWKLSNKNSGTKYLISNQHVYLNPQQYIIITKDAARLSNLYPIIPAVMLDVPTLPTYHFTNSNDAVALFDSRNALMDSVFYSSSWGGTNNRSLERLEPDGISLTQSNWGTSTNPNRATPGMKNSLTRKEFDVTIRRISFSPVNSNAGESVQLQAVIFNKGKQALNGFDVAFYEDTNGDSLFSTDEQFSLQQLNNSITPLDSTNVIATSASLAIGTHNFLLRVTTANDEDTLNNSLKIQLVVGVQPQTVVVNEIMYAPSGSEPEWIELYNQSSLVIDLNGWKISNKTTSSKYTIASSSRLLNSLEYIVLTKDTARFNTAHSGTSNVIEVSAMPTFLFGNNGDAVVLYDNRNTTIDSVRYFPSWGGTNSHSLERIEATLSSSDSTNWGTSEDSLFSTPSFQNSITPREYDLAISRIFTTLNSSSINLNVVVQNVGRQSAMTWSVSFFFDANYDSITQSSELLSLQNSSDPLLTNDSTIIMFAWNNPPSGEQRIIVRIDFEQDLRLSNNMLNELLGVSFPTKSLVINEIMYDPLPGRSEWIELYNPTQTPVNVKNWGLHDLGGTLTYSVITFGVDAIVPPNGFLLLLVTNDTSYIFNRFPYLLQPDSLTIIFCLNRSVLSIFNNEGDEVVLFDLSGKTIDSVRYNSDWHNSLLDNVSERSLERINPNHESTDKRNWSTSANANGGTPGKPNSIFTTVVPSEGSLSVSPNPFSPDADGFEDFVLISYKVPTTTALLRVRLYDSKGRLVRTLADHEPSGSNGELIWDGMNDEREKVPMGIYVILFEALDGGGNQVQAMKTVVVVAVKL